MSIVPVATAGAPRALAVKPSALASGADHQRAVVDKRLAAVIVVVVGQGQDPGIAHDQVARAADRAAVAGEERLIDGERPHGQGDIAAAGPPPLSVPMVWLKLFKSMPGGGVVGQIHPGGRRQRGCHAKTAGCRR